MLAEDLIDSRARSASITARFEGERLLGPKLAIVNPPLWEMGHLGWFQERWCLRLRPDGRLEDSLLQNADALYDSSAVAHDTRWDLPLPSMKETSSYLAAVLERTLERIEREPQNESLRYYVRLATFHEDMHAEAFHYTCQTLGYPVLEEKRAIEMQAGDVEVPGGKFVQGAVPGKDQFVFDNEKWAHEVELAPFRIARSPVSNSQFLAFVEEGGAPPRYWKKVDRAWHERRFERWQPLVPQAPVRHVDWNEAQAWCRWARRRLPTEAEWERAMAAGALVWGEVWEWTASVFAPYRGFVVDPYRDYSVPWFGTHKVLRGASFATPRRLARPTFRNFYTAERGDVFAGFRSCAL